MWTYRGQKRPEFAQEPGEGQESVWDFPRPPALQPCRRTIRVEGPRERIAETVSSHRILETASPPTYFLPPDSVKQELLVLTDDVSMCEWKGIAKYWALKSKPHLPVAWSYSNPRLAFEAIRDHFCFYPNRVTCFIDDERVRAQPGTFYGGWITDDVVGPFKGDPGTQNW